MQWNIEKMIIITIKHLQINKSLALNSPKGVSILFNKSYMISVDITSN